jgi:hypothetical protein
MDRGLCHSCHVKPILGRKRKYCEEHSRLASVLWKRERRRLWKEKGQKYWQDAWENKTPEERKAYFRQYMRQYRRRKANEVRDLDSTWTPEGVPKGSEMCLHLHPRRGATAPATPLDSDPGPLKENQ